MTALTRHERWLEYEASDEQGDEWWEADRCGRERVARLLRERQEGQEG